MSERNRIEKATMADAPRIQELVSSFAAIGEMLPRPLAEIYEHLRDFFIVRERQEVVACAALHIMWEDLAEVRSLAVVENNQDQGVGLLLVNACLEEARRLGIRTVFALTQQPAFFERAGFTRPT
jgi:amino-acid N-acetyltransferase